jgi:hypothetical protein
MKLVDRGLPLILSHSNVLATKAAPKSAALTSAPSLTSQFSLAVHPDCHGPAPLPYVASDSRVTYSAKDFIPTSTLYLFDLIFSFTHQPPTPPALYPLISLSITIPASSSPTNSTRIEPLLGDTYAGAGTIMLENKRLTPFLTSSPGSLQVLLKPRDALPDADASFRLAQAPIAGVVNKVHLDMVGGAGSAARGLVAVMVTESYLLADGSTGEVSSVKRGGGEVDLSENAGVTRRAICFCFK